MDVSFRRRLVPRKMKSYCPGYERRAELGLIVIIIIM